MSAKCNDIIKFSLSLKMKKKQAPVPPPKRLFSVQPVFFATYKKTLEINIYVKYVIYKFCLRRFSLKCIIKKNYLSRYSTLKGHRNFNILILFILSFVFLHMLLSIFFLSWVVSL